MKLTCASIFASNMVLQREKEIRIFGTNIPNTKVDIHFMGNNYQSRSDEEGHWQIQMGPFEAAVEKDMVISSCQETITLQNIAIGEVWIAGGQSNMEFFMRWDKDLETALESCENEMIRFYDVPRVQTERIRAERSYADFGFWRICNKENLQFYSAVGYYFANKLQRELNCPVGIIGCNCGGTRACCWMDEDSIIKYGEVWLTEYKNDLKKIPDLYMAEEQFSTDPMTDKSKPFADPFSDRMMKGMPMDEMMAILKQWMADDSGPMIGPWHEWRPGGLYRTMLKTITPYTVRGVIYYQGESDETHADLYARMLEGLVTCWRRDFNDNLPFLMVQLAPFGELIGNGGKYYPELREQQAAAAKNIPDVYLVSIGDVGNEYDIHPKEKAPVGYRLALMALGKIYGHSILCEAPVPSEMKKSKDSIQISFSNTGSGLCLKGEDVHALELYVNHNKVANDTFSCHPDGNMLVIDDLHLDNNSEIEIRFAKTPYYEVNLFNEAGIPVMPFVVKL